MKTRLKDAPLLEAFMLLTIVAALPGCKRGTNTPATETPMAQQQPVLPTAPGPMSGTSGAPNQAAGVAWTVPAGWEVGPARQMRIATYRIHAIADDPEDAECAVYFFGAGQGGTVQANLDRWAQQFSSAKGQAPAEPTNMGKRTIAGLTVSTITVSGTYLGGGGMMSQEQVKKPNFRMRGAIVEAPQGLVFFKLTGPLNTVAAAEGDFNALLNSLHPQ